MPRNQEKDIQVIYEFIKTGERRSSFKSVFPTSKKPDSFIYNWFNTPWVKNKIKEIGNNMDIFNEFVDSTLIKILKDSEANNKDKVAAARVWSEIRQRINNEIKIENNIDFSKISDETLENVVDKLLKNQKTKEILND